MYQKALNHAGELSGIRRLADGACIPLDPANRDYAEFLAWEAAGNTAAEPDPVPVPVPAIVTRFQAKAALLNAGLLAQVETLMADPATPAITRLAWVEALSFERSSPTVAAMGAALGLADADIDALFIAAAEIAA